MTNPAKHHGEHRAANPPRRVHDRKYMTPKEIVRVINQYLEDERKRRLESLMRELEIDRKKRGVEAFGAST